MVEKHYCYVVARDFGFAPNPFGRYCTLATCKHKIRKSAKINDWIFGISSKSVGSKLIFAMKVSRKITFDEYWNSEEFIYKKPVMNGSLKQMYGDNIYYLDKQTSKWCQVNSHHSKDNGEINIYNLNRDTSGEYVLISDHYYYFGKESIDIPKKWRGTFQVGRGHKYLKRIIAKRMIAWLEENYDKGYNGDPKSFTGFQRYDGVS